MNELFVLLILACTILDVQSTRSLISKLGSRIELNTSTKFLVDKLGLVPGLILGVGGVSILVTSVLYAWHSTLALAYYAGIKTMLAGMQIGRYKKLGF